MEGQHRDLEKQQKKEIVSVWKVFHFADRLDFFLMFLGAICGILHGASIPAFSFIFGEILDALNATGDIYQAVTDASIYFIYLGLACIVVSFGQYAFFSISAQRQTKKLRETYFSSVMQQEIAWYDKQQSGILMEKLSSDTVIVSEALGEKLGQIFQYLSSFVCSFIFGILEGWKLTLVLLAVTPLIALSSAILMKAIASSTAQGQKAYAEAGAIANEVLSGIRTVASFGNEQKEYERYTSHLGKASKAGIKGGVFAGVGVGFNSFVYNGSQALALWYGAKLVLDGEYTGGQVTAVYFSVVFASMYLGQASPSIQLLNKARVVMGNFIGTIQRAPRISMNPEGKKIEDLKGNIALKDVNFRYETRPEVPVLQGLSLNIEPGKVVALVGPSGSGKSSIVSLVQRFYDPENGIISVDGVDLKNLDLQWWRKQLGLVSQEPVLFAGTIGENIAFGKPGASQEDIEQAAKLANAHKFIMELPQRYQTFVGERGAQLSGGQKQRIAIARAIIKNPKILLLDEATSALDTESERIVQEALDSVMKGRTTIVIAHRLSTIRNADVIAVIKKGQLAELGNHDDLYEKKGIYYELVKAQGLQQVHGKQESKATVLSHVTSQDDKSDVKNEEKDEKEVEGDKKKKKKKADVEQVSFSRLMSLNKPEAPLLFLGIFVSAINAATSPIISLIFSRLLDLFYQPSEVIQQNADRYSGYFAGLAGVIFLTSVLQYWLFSICGERLTRRLRSMAFKSILRQEISFFDMPQHLPSILTTNLASDATLVQGLMGPRLGTQIQSVISIVGGLIVAFVAGWKLTLVVLASSPLMVFAQVMEVLSYSGFSSKTKGSMSQANQTASEAISNIRVVYAFTMEGKFIEKYKKFLDQPYRLATRKSMVSGTLYGIGEATQYAAFTLIFWYGGKLGAAGEMTFLEIMQVFIGIITAAMSIGTASALAPDANKAKLAASNIFKLIDRKSKIDPFSQEGRAPNGNSSIHLEGLHFAYPSRPDVQLFKDLHLDIKEGQICAVVGPSGSGKSSIVALLERFYDPIEGTISIGGENTSDLNIQQLRRMVSLVGQEPVLFSGTIGENIAYGKLDATTDEIMAAAKVANAHSFIEQLPRGYDTPVGERGAQLSGGQKQRIAIARAIIKNPKILLLDEATSALDTESERIVQEALDSVMKGRTTIVIAHRLSTIRNADVIAVVAGGRVVEYGNHEELMKAEGIYHKLVELQSR